MQEVVVRLRFNSACLGSAKRRLKSEQVVFCMLRDTQGRVMFLPSWWHERMLYAAQLANSGYALVPRIAWDSAVDGTLRPDWRRIVVPARADPGKRARYAVHEAFPPGSEIGVRAVLPAGLTADQFSELLTIVGTYRGISPFVDEAQSYGTFEVVSVMPAVRGDRK